MAIKRSVQCFLLVLLAGMAAASADSRPPDFVVFLADDHGYLDTPLFGAKGAQTPALSQLAEDGMLFTHAFVASPSCAPSRAALLTAQYPQNNGIEANHDYDHFEGVTSMLHDFVELGYETAAFGKVEHGINNPKNHWDEGFTHVGSNRLDLAEVEAFLRQRDRGKPLLLFVGTRHPHVPWTQDGLRYDPEAVDLPPRSIDTPQTRVNRAQYLEDVHKMDKLLGETRELVNRYLGEETFMMFSSDHGAQWPFGKWNLYDNSVRVATVVSWPGQVEAGSVNGAMVSWVDILPTLLDLAGGGTDEGRDGLSFKNALLKGAEEHRDVILTSHTGDSSINVYPMRAARDREWLYIRNLHPEHLYATHMDRNIEKPHNLFWPTWEQAALKDPAAAEIVRAYRQRPAEELFYLPDDPHNLHNRVDDPEAAQALMRLRLQIDTYMQDTSDQAPVVGKPVLLPGPRGDKPRLVVFADMGNEPDEMQQMTHLLANANMFDIEGLIAVTGRYLRATPQPELFHQLVDAYGVVLPNLRMHATGWPSAESLRSVVAAGQAAYGKADVGEGKSSPGSRLLLDVMSRDDTRPIWVVMNAGSNTLAQALFDHRAEHGQAATERLVAKLQVFENGAQDDAGAWIANQFPDIFWIRSNNQTYAYGGPANDVQEGVLRGQRGPHTWQPFEYDNVGQLNWQNRHVRYGHGELGKQYPERRFRRGGIGFMEGGGTTPWLGFVDRGLFNPEKPWWGGWSGRFTREKTDNPWSRHQDVKASEQEDMPFRMFAEDADRWTDPETGQVYDNIFAPVWRWRRAMYNNFAARMDWSIKTFTEANHHPVAVVNGDSGDGILHYSTTAGGSYRFDASASSDPDRQALGFHWFFYPEAGTYQGELPAELPSDAVLDFAVPEDAAGGQIHLVLEVRDDDPELPLSDYRRIVIEVED